jgi:transcription antitermination factor NusG
MSSKDTYENHLHPETARWFAVYTNYKREKLIRKLLSAKGIEVYLPIQKVTRRYVRKIKHLELPLINCYVFVKITKSEYISVLVLKFIRFPNNLLSIPEAEIQLMKRIIGEHIDFTFEPITFVEGEEVEIIAGNLTGLEGKLVAQEGRQRFLIELTNLGYEFRMTIDPTMLRRKRAFSPRLEKA